MTPTLTYRQIKHFLFYHLHPSHFEKTTPKSSCESMTRAEYLATGREYKVLYETQEINSSRVSIEVLVLQSSGKYEGVTLSVFDCTSFNKNGPELLNTLKWLSKVKYHDGMSDYKYYWRFFEKFSFVNLTSPSETFGRAPRAAPRAPPGVSQRRGRSAGRNRRRDSWDLPVRAEDGNLPFSLRMCFINSVKSGGNPEDVDDLMFAPAYQEQEDVESWEGEWEGVSWHHLSLNQPTRSFSTAPR